MITIKQKFLISLIKNKIKYIIVPAICCIIYAVVQLLLPVMVQKFIDIICYDKKSNMLVVVIIGYIILVIVLSFSKIAKEYFGKQGALKITNSIRNDLLKKNILRGQLFYNEYTVGNVIEIMEKDIEILENFLINTAMPVFVDILTLLGMFIFFFYKNIYIGLGSLVVCLFVFVIIYLVQCKKSDCIVKEREENSKLTSLIGEIITLKKDINVMKAKKIILYKMELIMNKLKMRKIEKQKYLYRVWTSTLIALLLINVFSFLVGGFFYSNEIISFGFVYILYSYGNMLKDPLEKMQWYIQDFFVTQESCSRIYNMENFDDKINNGRNRLKNGIDRISIEHLYHKFDNNTVLKDINLELKNKEKLGIFGMSGSGKSTLCKLLCKLYDVQEGNIYVNNINILDLAIEDIRNNVAYVTANEQIYSASLKENLDMFSDRSFDDVVKIMKKYRLYKLLEIEENEIVQKLNEKLEIDKISTGKKQLINIMRLFFCEKSLIVFDEATANVSEEVEKEYYFLFEEIVKTHMVIIITHNVERLAKCDKIIMMRDGMIEESGLRKNLELDMNSLYYRYSGGGIIGR